MKISKIKIKNFRLLHDVQINLDDRTTVLVGRNNSGKTTLADAFSRFLHPSAVTFTIADFSTSSYEDFKTAWKHYEAGRLEKAREALPSILLTLHISYSNKIPKYGPLSAAIIDLNTECTTAQIEIKYALKAGSLDPFFEGIEPEPVANEELNLQHIISTIQDRIPKLFERSITAVDPGDPLNTKEIDIKTLRKIITVDFLKAQRELDDEKQKPKDLLGRIFQSLYESTTKERDNSAPNETAKRPQGSNR